jgi:virginiamycin A acetyltransferase
MALDLRRGVFKRLLKRTIFMLSLALTSLMIVAARIEKRMSKQEAVFVGFAQFLSLFPGVVGSYLRSAYYFGTLDKCSWEVHIGLGSYFPHRAASVGCNVAIGASCVIGNVSIDDGVMIASRVSMSSGKRQHLDESGYLSSQPSFDQITIGRNSWIGEGAIILARVGANCVVSAVSVVINDTPSGQLIAGNPSKVIRELKMKNAVSVSD